MIFRVCFIYLFCSIRFDIGKSMVGMYYDDFYKFVVKYKFMLVMENVICDDYMIEKLWCLFRFGFVLIVFGFFKVKVGINF